MSLGTNITKYREQREISQEYLAFKLGVDSEIVALWEEDKAQPSIAQLKLLALILQVTIDQLCEEPLNNPGLPLFSASMQYTKDVYIRAGKIALKNNLKINFISILAAAFLFLCILLFPNEKSWAIIPAILCATSIVSQIRMRRIVIKAAEQMITLNPNTRSEYCFYSDHFEVNSISDKTSSTRTTKYTEIVNTVQDEQYIYLFFTNKQYLIIDKSSCSHNIDKLYQLLEIASTKVNTQKSQTQKKGIKVLLNVFFALSIASLFMAMLLLGFVLAGAPDASTNLPEYMWTFFVFLPLPLTSFILGIIYKCKGYGCTRNIVLGAIMSTLLFLYGCFVFLPFPEISASAVMCATKLLG